MQNLFTKIRCVSWEKWRPTPQGSLRKAGIPAFDVLRVKYSLLHELFQLLGKPNSCCSQLRTPCSLGLSVCKLNALNPARDRWVFEKYTQPLNMLDHIASAAVCRWATKLTETIVAALCCQQLTAATTAAAGQRPGVKTMTATDGKTMHPLALDLAGELRPAAYKVVERYASILVDTEVLHDLIDGVLHVQQLAHVQEILPGRVSRERSSNVIIQNGFKAKLLIILFTIILLACAIFWVNVKFGNLYM